MRYLSLKDEEPSSSDPAHSHKGNWQPWPIRAPFLIFFASLCLSLTLIAEALLQRSERDGGLIFGDFTQINGGKISRTAEFISSYLPTTISVIFGLLWAVPEHDYKRLEAFFQMSRPGGATAKDSLLLDYPYSSPHSLPWVAFKRRHWAVFFSSTMALFSVVYLIPIMPGIIEETQVIKSIDAEIPGTMLPTNMNKKFPTEFAYQAYRYAWLNGTLPNFTTTEYTVLPFIVNTTKDLRENETWVGESILYEADLKCQKAKVEENSWGFNITNGRDCNWGFVDIGNYNYNELELGLMETKNLTVVLDHGLNFRFESPWNNLFMGHAAAEQEELQRSKQDLYSLSSPLGTCPKSSAFLGIWANPRDDAVRSTLPTNWTAVFCEPTYWSQPVKATVRIESSRSIIEGVERFGDRKPFNDFNSTWFDGLASTGWTEPPSADMDSQQRVVNFGNPPLEYPRPGYQLPSRFGTFPSGIQLLNSRSLAGLTLLGHTNKTLPSLLDPDVLGKAYSDAYKLLFSFAFASGLKELESPAPSMIKITRQFETETYAINALWCRLTQAGFVVLAILTICLLVFTWGRQTNLDGEPNSLLESMLAIRTLSHDGMLHNSEFCNPSVLRDSLIHGGHRYQLRLIDGQGPVIEKIKSGSTSNIPLLDPKDLDESQLKPYKSKISWELSLTAGISYSSFFGTLLVILVSIYIYSIKCNGLPTVAPTNSFGYKILFTYIPTILGMAVEPLLVVLGSYACMVGPYETLKFGDGQRSSKSLVLDYDKTPPHFQLFQSLKVRNFVLSALTTAIILANFLAVAFGGLFSPTTRVFIVSEDLNHYSSPMIVRNLSDPIDAAYNTLPPEVYYLLAGNLSGSGSLPEWTTPEMFILPFNTSAAHEGRLDDQQSTSLGFGTNVSCEVLPEELFARNMSLNSVLTGDAVFNSLVVDHRCWEGNTNLPNQTIKTYQWNQDVNPSTDFFLKSSICPGTFFVGWGELPGDPTPKNFTFPYQPLNQTEYVVLACTSNTKIMEVSVSVDEGGYVQWYDVLKTLSLSDAKKFFGWRTTTDPTTDFDSSFQDRIAAAASTDTKEYDFDYGFNTGVDDPFSNPHTTRWLNYLMVKREPDVRRHLKNVTHIPDTKHVAKAFEDVYASLFAIYLSLHSSDCFEFGGTQKVQGTSRITQDRVELSAPMFGIATAILGFFLIVIFYVYWMRPGSDLSHMPTNLAATHTLLYASNALEDCIRLYGQNTKARALKLLGLGNTYNYGFFVGWDTKQHFGVYKEVPSGEESGEKDSLMKR